MFQSLHQHHGQTRRKTSYYIEIMMVVIIIFFICNVLIPLSTLTRSSTYWNAEPQEEVLLMPPSVVMERRRESPGRELPGLSAPSVPKIVIDNNNYNNNYNYNNSSNIESIKKSADQQKGTTQQQQKEGSFAYSYIFSGCTKTSCLGYVLNTIAAAYMLKVSKSNAQLIVQVRMSAQTSDDDEKLDPLYEQWLHKCGVKIRYLPKVKIDNFGTANLEKFRVMEMTEFDRVLFLDGDVLPLCNLDYLFNESYNTDGVLSDFVTVSDSVAPFAGGFFLVTPEKDEFGRVMDIIHRHRNRTVTPDKFDQKLGWGHVIAEDDYWQSWWNKGNNWTFYAAHADQGLLYHWIRYERGNYTWLNVNKMEKWELVGTKDVEYWKTQTNYAVPKITSDDNLNDRYIARVQYKKYRPDMGPLGRGCGAPPLKRKLEWARHAPFRDYFHFAGTNKPWFESIKADDNLFCSTSDLSLLTAFERGKDVWLCALREANKTLGLGLPSVIVANKGNPVGGGGDQNIKFPQILRQNAEVPVPQATYSYA